MRDEYDFSNAKRVKDVPHLARLQAEGTGKTRITIMLDNDILESFRRKAQDAGMGYQTLINQALKSYVGGALLNEETLRRVIRDEFNNLSSG